MIHLGSTKPVPSSKEKERILRTCSRPLRAVLSSPVDHQPRWKPRRQTTRPCRDCVLPFSVCDERAWRCNRTTCIRPGKRTGYLRIHRENRMVVLPPHSGQCPQDSPPPSVSPRDVPLVLPAGRVFVAAKYPVPLAARCWMALQAYVYPLYGDRSIVSIRVTLHVRNERLFCCVVLILLHYDAS